jgi:4-hydroxy-3-methylbut-2-enyl diphosphate reductase
VHAEAEVRQLKTIDATCPLVTKVHMEAKRFAADDVDIVLIGHEGTRRSSGRPVRRPSTCTSSTGSRRPQQVVVRDPAKVAYLSQTTLSVDETNITVDALRQRFPLLQGPPSADICYATQNRQVAVKEIAEAADLVLVVGSGNSSNSVRLVEVALDAGARTSYLVDDASEIDEAWLQGVTTVGLTSGASVPETLVQQVMQWLAERGYGDVVEVESAQEHLQFALPPELRRDLRAAGISESLKGSGRPALPRSAADQRHYRGDGRPRHQDGAPSTRPFEQLAWPGAAAATRSAGRPRRAQPRAPARRRTSGGITTTAGQVLPVHADRGEQQADRKAMAKASRRPGPAAHSARAPMGPPAARCSRDGTPGRSCPRRSASRAGP